MSPGRCDGHGGVRGDLGVRLPGKADPIKPDDSGYDTGRPRGASPGSSIVLDNRHTLGYGPGLN